MKKRTSARQQAKKAAAASKDGNVVLQGRTKYIAYFLLVVLLGSTFLEVFRMLLL